MCGVAGFFHYKEPRRPGNESEVTRMTDALQSRGPDESGSVSMPGICLGHRRLKVIDLIGGQQPMKSPDGRYHLVFNGEIYGFKSLRSRYESGGRIFKSSSDTECLLACLEELWDGAFSELDGMYAFACYDKEKQELLLATDAFGKKPLYYTDLNGTLVFASELKSLLQYPGVKRSISTRALNEYLAYEYIPAPGTIFQNIFKLDRGTCLKVSPSGLNILTYRKDFPAENHDLTIEESVDRLRSELDLAVQKRLVSDVPLGVFLSGGLDSTAVLGTVKKLQPDRKIKSFSIGFEEASFDESGYARFAARKYDTEHTEFICSANTMIERHQEILSYLDEPMADASFIPTYLLCEMVRKHVTVALSGDGGDELFCGYPTFEAESLAQKMQRMPVWMLKVMKKAVNMLPVSRDNLSVDFKLKQFFKGLPADTAKRNHVWLGSFDDAERGGILHPDFVSQESPYLLLSEITSSDNPMRYLQELYFRFYLQNDILVKVDRASMANSLEVRSPLLDDRFFLRMMQVPVGYKYQKGITKYVFKQAMRGRVPDRIIDRPKKGFGIPVADWIRKDLKEAFDSKLGPANIRKTGLFNEHKVKELLNQHQTGKKDNRKQLWTLYVFQIWAENWGL